jgi:peptidoglycan biosynthesis protein MviN/MurJ (putative lipid II flippase)
MVNGYYSRHNTLRPMVLGTVAAAASFPVYRVLCGSLGGPGIALATTACFWLTLLAMLTDYSVRYGAAEGFTPARLVATVVKAVGVVIAGVVAAEFGGKWLAPQAVTVPATLLRLVVIASAYGLVVGAGALLVGGEEASSFRSLLKGIARRAGLPLDRGPS